MVKQKWGREGMQVAACVRLETNQAVFERLCWSMYCAEEASQAVRDRWCRMGDAIGGFTVENLSGLQRSDVDRLLQSAGVIQNRARLEALVANARLFEGLVLEHGSFPSWLDGVASDGFSRMAVLVSKFERVTPAVASSLLKWLYRP